MMTVKVLERKKNPLMKREEVNAIYEHAGKPTPTRDVILPHLEKSLKADKDLILIDKIFSINGKGESRLKVLVYSKKEDVPRDKAEIIKKRAEKRKKEAPPAQEAKPEEKPAEKGEKPREGKGEPSKEENKEGKEEK
jgi:ribosomal protein S24E